MYTWLNWGILGLLLVPGIAYGEMNSNNFYIYADSIGLNGGEIATSTSYTLNGTTNDSPGGQVTSTSYNIYGGYQAMEVQESLSVSLDTTALALGTLSTSVVTTASAIVTVITNSNSGYSVSFSGVSGTMVASVSDGTVTAGSEEYGVSVTGAHTAFADDRSVVAGRILASSSNPTLGDAATLNFKAAAAVGTAAATFAQTITLTASANF